MIPLAFFLVYVRHKQNTVTYAMIIGGLLAWLSHFVLDSFYNHGLGIAIYWPISDAVLNLPIPWFNTLDPSISLLSKFNLSVFGVEFLFYFPVFLTALIFRKRLLSSKRVCT
jgi:membrane-bound metal-dependent hydrolase YbcI (DUF457 family)